MKVLKLMKLLIPSIMLAMTLTSALPAANQYGSWQSSRGLTPGYTISLRSTEYQRWITKDSGINMSFEGTVLQDSARFVFLGAEGYNLGNAMARNKTGYLQSVSKTDRYLVWDTTKRILRLKKKKHIAKNPDRYWDMFRFDEYSSASFMESTLSINPTTNTAPDDVEWDTILFANEYHTGGVQEIRASTYDSKLPKMKWDIFKHNK